MHTIDLRSDTVTLPTKEMREAISNAELGDDVFQEDPTINNLEKLAAKKFNKEAAVFLPSGTMANLVAVLTHCNRGDEVMLGDQSHTFLYEAGGISSFGGVHSRQLKNHNDGTIHLNDIKNAIRKKDVHFPPSRLICLENTHNRCFGMPLETNYVNEVVDIAKNNDMSVHVDGARIFNAAVATGSTVADLTKNVDSVSFCLSKGLSAPSGSLLCGDKNFIHRARFNRKALGGGMRQAGILAAAGVVAIDIMSAKIIEDHRNAKALAFGIAKIDGINIETEKIKTNIIYFKLDHPKINSESLLDIMSKKNIRFFELGPNWFRLVTHSGISKENIDYVISEFDSFFSQA
ncbi:low-specificity L-threonine aldolase [bacterium]|jgi:threonine aldolase|nr:low-specificity L-threonine aldolase [bacterium]MBT6019162.1 low-specificity L-threonine aldolase [bacterium]MBT6778158.1 low-specificity L-threonine aldolase [bacterium]